MALANITSQFRFALMSKVYNKWITPNQKILDIGCGNGVVSLEISKKFKVKIYGCDIDKYLAYDIPFVKMKSDDTLPYKSNSFDIAMFNDVLHHTDFENQSKLIKEALRVAKEVLIFEVRPTTLGELSDYIINRIHHKNMDIPFTFRKTEKWQAIFRKLNSKFETVELKRPFFYPFSHVAFCLKGK